MGLACAAGKNCSTSPHGGAPGAVYDCIRHSLYPPCAVCACTANLVCVGRGLQKPEGTQVAELNQLEQFLRQPDAIMEPNILDVLRRYVSDGGNPATVVEMLSDNYVGAAHGKAWLSLCMPFRRRSCAPLPQQQLLCKE